MLNKMSVKRRIFVLIKIHLGGSQMAKWSSAPSSAASRHPNTPPPQCTTTDPGWPQNGRPLAYQAESLLKRRGPFWLDTCIWMGIWEWSADSLGTCWGILRASQGCPQAAPKALPDCSLWNPWPETMALCANYGSQNSESKDTQLPLNSQFWDQRPARRIVTPEEPTNPFAALR